MLSISTKLDHIHSDTEIADVVSLSFDLRQKSRIRVTLQSGVEAALYMQRGTILRGGDFLQADSGEIIEVIASLVPDTVGQNPPAEMKPRGVIHWVSATEGKEVKLRLYDRLFLAEAPGKATGNYLDDVNADSLKVIKAIAEPAIVNCQPETVFQFEREGYFVSDRYDHSAETPVFNLTIGLKETSDK